jgi:putative endonuclease
MGGFYIYVLYSRIYQKIYIGYSENPEKRLASHNDDRNRDWTKSYRPWEIVYTEQFNTKKEALTREKQLKSSKGREFVREKIIAQLVQSVS